VEPSSTYYWEETFSHSHTKSITAMLGGDSGERAFWADALYQSALQDNLGPGRW